jgi:hypothetical protein
LKPSLTGNRFQNRLTRGLPPLYRALGAFTLSELLVAAALGLIVLSAAGSVLVSHIRTTTVQTLQLRFQDDWARFSNLIETEVGEGQSLTAVVQAAQCPAEALPGRDLLFTINVPVIVDNNAVNTQISYYQVGPDLVRCGPPITEEGTLDRTTPPVDLVLLRNAILTINPNPPNARLVRYNLTLRLPTPPPGYAANRFDTTFPAPAQFVQARTKANYIDN